jgi:hypothetical protein
LSHQKISFIKSGVRIAGYLVLGYIAIGFGIPPLGVAAGLLVLSEVLGIIEEVGY